MQHQPDQYGNIMPKAQPKRLMSAGRILELEREVSRLEQANRELRSRADKCAASLHHREHGMLGSCQDEAPGGFTMP